MKSVPQCTAGNKGSGGRVHEKMQMIGVVGAGTMGAGIAQVALLSGFSVTLFDVQEAVLSSAMTDIRKRLHRLVDKGVRTAAEVLEAMGRLRTTSTLRALATADFVIEAVPERIDLKKQLFAELDLHCAETTILATNTSSLSVSVIASATKNPSRVVGMHFFNPAPFMRLVEVVVGDDTAEDTVARTVACAEAFGKVPTICQDTPGFIVNRVARNYYGEALRIVSEGRADIRTVDTLMEQGAGFRMGPFRLMDLIGLDVNYDVTQSVYAAYHQEPRFRPSHIQARLVACGRYGQKTGRGFYTYAANGALIDESDDDVPVMVDCKDVPLESVYVVGDTLLARALQTRISERTGRALSACGYVYEKPLQPWDEVALRLRTEELEAVVRKVQPSFVIASFGDDNDGHRKLMCAIGKALPREAMVAVDIAGPSATEQAAWLGGHGRVRGFSAVLPLTADVRAVEWTRPAQVTCADGREAHVVDATVVSIFERIGFRPMCVADGSGGIMMRILSMILNEAAEALQEGIASADAIDTAMRLGTNYPYGPIAWLALIGLGTVQSTLAALQDAYGPERYRLSSWVRDRLLTELMKRERPSFEPESHLTRNESVNIVNCVSR